MAQTLTHNQHGQIANAPVADAAGHAKRRAFKTMSRDAKQAASNPQARITLDAHRDHNLPRLMDA